MADRDVELVDLAGADTSPTISSDLVYGAEAQADVVGVQPRPVRGQATQVNRAIASLPHEDESRGLRGATVPWLAPELTCRRIKGCIIGLL